ncbi:hypothetical protein DLM77_06345 [Leptospira yasudae]|uniref:Uncharacterized protein n=1 Tax=Leptospira yasudae TaxID=2202201 RepID=A0ABX9M696_9LEPT|nr:hypothetical protein DLM77_06345 [Leptospira yasudae]
MQGSGIHANRNPHFRLRPPVKAAVNFTQEHKSEIAEKIDSVSLRDFPESRSMGDSSKKEPQNSR